MAYSNQNPQLNLEQPPRRNESSTANSAGIIIALIVILVILGLFVYDNSQRGNITSATKKPPQVNLQHVPAASQNTGINHQ